MNSLAHYWQTSSATDKLFAASILLFFGFVGIDWSIAKNGAYLAVLTALGVLLFSRGTAAESRNRLDTLEWALIAVIVLWVAHSVLSWWVNDMPLHGNTHIKGRQSKLLLFIPLFLFIRRRGLPEWVFWSGALLGTFIVGIDGLTLFFQNDTEEALKGLSRQGEGHYTIQIAVMMAVLVAYLWVAAIRCLRVSKPAAMLVLLGSLIGLAFVFASGVRGSWLALVAAGLMILIYSLREVGPKAWLFFLTVCLVVAVFFASVPFARNAVERIYTGIYSYVEKDVKTTSIGIRFELWESALELGKKYPVFGTGPGRFSDALVREFPEKKWLREFEYPHNQYFAALASRGIPGLLLLLLSLGLPGYIFWKNFREGDEDLRYIAFAGLMLVVTFAISGLTYDHLEKRLQITFYAVNLALLLGMLKWRHAKSSDEAGGPAQVL